MFAEFETNLRKDSWKASQRQRRAGVYKGRRPSVDVSQVRALKQEDIGPSAIARTLGIGRVSVYPALGEPRIWCGLRPRAVFAGLDPAIAGLASAIGWQGSCKASE